jgi:hypothetical protein
VLAAYEPISQALLRIFGLALADVACGVELRHDHGSQYLTCYFQGQSRIHGFTLRFDFVGEFQTNIVVNASTALSRSKSSTVTPTKIACNSRPLSPSMATSTTANRVSKNSAPAAHSKPAATTKTPSA